MIKNNLDKDFINSVIDSINNSMKNIDKLNDYAKKLVEFELPAGAISRIFHDEIVRQLKKHKNFADARDGVSDFSYKGERWELKTNRKTNDIGINGVNKIFIQIIFYHDFLKKNTYI